MEVSPGGVLTVEVALVAESDVPEALAAAPRLPLLDVGGAGAEGSESAVVFVASPVALHALFEAASEPPLRVAAPDGGLVYEDECVELFVASPEEPFAYREIVVNPAGALYGAEVRNPDESRATWMLVPGRLPEGLSVAVAGEPAGQPPSEWTRWSCRLSIPWRSLSAPYRPPAPGEERRLNAYRIARGASTRYLALSPTLRSAPPDFHVPSRFARAVFLPPAVLARSC
jgi:hypothetical protein